MSARDANSKRLLSQRAIALRRRSKLSRRLKVCLTFGGSAPQIVQALTYSPATKVTPTDKEIAMTTIRKHPISFACDRTAILTLMAFAWPGVGVGAVGTGVAIASTVSSWTMG